MKVVVVVIIIIIIIIITIKVRVTYCFLLSFIILSIFLSSLKTHTKQQHIQTPKKLNQLPTNDIKLHTRNTQSTKFCMHADIIFAFIIIIVLRLCAYYVNHIYELQIKNTVEVIIICAAGTPGKPFGGCMRHFNMIEANMKLRYSARLFHDDCKICQI